jgi:hypothetical protein
MAVNDLSEGGKNKYRLIDGHHRLEAIARFIKLNPTARVEVLFIVYDHLNEEEEKEVYRLLNKGRRQSLDDFIHVQQADFPILGWMQKDFPAKVKVYPLKGTEQGFKFWHLMQAYLLRFSAGGGGAGRQESLERIKRFTVEDYKSLKTFAEDFIAAFGLPTKGSNPFATSVSISCVAKTYYCNLEELSRVEIRERWQARVSTDPAVKQIMATQALSAARLLTETMVAAMNRGYRTKLAITPAEYQVRHKLPEPSPAKPVDVAKVPA